MQGSSDAGGTAGRGGYIRSGMPDRGLPFQPGRDPKGAVEDQRAQDPAKPRRITSLGDIHVSRAYAVRERYRHRNDGGGVALNGKWLCEDEDAAELAVGWIQEPASEEAVGIHRYRRGRRREGLAASRVERDTCLRDLAGGGETGHHDVDRIPSSDQL